MIMSIVFKGITGTVLNIEGEPMTEALVTVEGTGRSYSVSKRLGYFKIILPPGFYGLIISCHEYQDHNVALTVIEEALINIKVSLVQKGRKQPEVYQGTIVSSAAQQIDVTDRTITEPFKGNITTGIKGI